jgi:hypothetical protein
MSTSPAEIINKAQEYAGSQVDRAQSFVNRLSELSEVEFHIGKPEPWSWDKYDKAEEAMARLTSARPTPPSISGALGIRDMLGLEAPTAPEITIPDMAETVIPQFTGLKPTLEYPSKPDVKLPEAPGVPDLGEQPYIPGRPTVTLPAPPSIDAIDIPPMPELDLPSLTVDLPADDLVAPTNVYEFDEKAYVSALGDSVKAALILEIETGGSGMQADDERALWQRVLDRENSLYGQAVSDVMSEHAVRGFSAPDGALAGAVERAKLRTLGALSTASRDIALKQADLKVSGRQFAISRAMELETLSINFHNTLMERSLNVSKALLQAGISIFTAQVDRFKLRMDAVRAAVQIYESKLQGAILRTQNYKERLEASTMKSEKALQIYQHQLSGINAMIGLYKSEMDAARLHSEMQRMKLEVYKINVESYRMVVQTKEAEFKMYQASVQGEGEKMKAYESDLRAYQAEMEGVKLRAQTEMQKVQAHTQKATTELQAFNAKIAAHKAELESVTSVIRAMHDGYQADVGAYGQEANAIAKAFDIYISTGKLNADTGMAAARQDVENAKLQLEKLSQQATLRLSAARTGVDVFKNLASGALSSINTLSSINQNIEGGT